MRCETFRLGDICTFIDYRGKTPPKTSNGIPLVTAKIIKNSMIQEPQEFIAENYYNEWMRRGIPQKGDVIFTTEAPLGEVARIKTDDKLAFAQRIIVLEPNTQQLNAGYLFYALQDIVLKNRIAARATGTTVIGIKAAELKKVEIDLPPLQQQEKIADILSSLDDKIELNNKINNNLFEQAQAIFENEFLSLQSFPDGWKLASLIDIADYLNGLAMQKYRPSTDEIGIPVLKIKELRQGCCDDNSEFCSPSIKSDYIIHDGDVIFSWSGSLLVDFWCGGICGLNQHLFKVSSNKYDKWFYYAWTKHHLDRFIAVAADKATTMGHIKRDELAKAEVLIPNEADYNRIGALLQPICDLIISNRIENKKLAKTRDSLLPKLMSGEIDMSEVEYE